VNHALLWTLCSAAVAVGALHALAPDHFLPVAAVARARGWSAARTARVALLCGFGHVTVSALLGVLALAFGIELLSSLGRRMESVAGLLLVGFGVAYAVWGVRRALAARVHGHHHHHYDHVHDASRATVWSLFAIYCADPCVAVLPILFAAAPLGAAGTVLVVATYELATMASMLVLVLLAHASARRLKSPLLERYGDGAAGAFIALTGIAVAWLGL
jgi:nickel/cobalt transporter (NicO) family protein